MQLITHFDPAAQRLRPEALKLQRRDWLDAAEVAPRFLEPAGLPNPRHTQV